MSPVRTDASARERPFGTWEGAAARRGPRVAAGEGPPGPGRSQAILHRKRETWGPRSLSGACDGVASAWRGELQALLHARLRPDRSPLRRIPLLSLRHRALEREEKPRPAEGQVRRIRAW